MKQPIQKLKRFVNDGFSNLLKGLNVKGYDGNTATEYSSQGILTDDLLIELTTKEGIGKRTIDLLTGDMTREWFEVKNDTDGEINDKLNKLYAPTKLRQVLRWSLGVGGGVIFMGIDDGQDADKPVNVNKIKDVKWLKVFNKKEVTHRPTEIYTDEKSEKYGMPEWYWIQNAGMKEAIKVHETRLLLFDGEDVTNDQRVANDGWGYSIFQSTYDSLKDLVVTWNFVLRTIQEFRKSILKIDNVFDLLANNEEGLRERLRVLDATSSILNRELIDRNTEEFEYKTASLQGLAELVTKKELQYCAEMGIPLTFLFGQTPQGLNATGKGEERIYYDKISVMQMDTIIEPLSRLILYIMLSSEGPTKGKEIDGWEIVFNSLWQQTLEEQIKTRLEQTKMDDINIKNGTLTAEIVRNSRYGSGEYSFETDLSLGAEPEEHTSIEVKEEQNINE